MNLQTALRIGEEMLKASSIDSFKLDTQILLLKATNLSKSDLYCRPNIQITPQNYEKFIFYLKERQKYKPVSKIIGYKEFYSLDFLTNINTLDPRADTETLIDVAKNLLFTEKKYSFLELGTGTGCIIITLLKIFTVSRGTSRDISHDALTIAKLNSKKHGVNSRLKLEQADMFDKLRGKYDLLISNPPYIKESDLTRLANEVKYFDPISALNGGVDGLIYYKIIAEKAKNYLNNGALIILEIGFDQAADVINIFQQEAYILIDKYQDLAGHYRCLAFRVAI